MPRTAAIDQLAARVQDASAGSDWDLLEVAVRELAPRLQALAVKGPWNAAERAALLRLRGAHDRAAAAAARASASLQEKLDDMRSNKEGWMAYALAGELEPGDYPR